MGKTKDSGLDGLLVVDKPVGWTSHDVVAKLRGILQQRRCGHSGTLDPDATGILLVGFGRVTKLLPYLTALPKVYRGEIVLGASTSTLDSSGTVLATFEMGGVRLEAAQEAARRFVGDILQVPPMVSAIQIDGRRLHELAREGIEVDRAPRPVHVERFDVNGWASPGVLSIEVECGSGTYIRSLAADLGEALGGAAHLRNLRRTRIGSFEESAAATMEGPGAATSTTPLLSPTAALRDYPSVTVPADRVGSVRNGIPYDLDGRTGPIALVDAMGDLLAVGETTASGRARLGVVLPAR